METPARWARITGHQGLARHEAFALRQSPSPAYSLHELSEEALIVYALSHLPDVCVTFMFHEASILEMRHVPSLFADDLQPIP
jgi:hypothetical protein